MADFGFTPGETFGLDFWEEGARTFRDIGAALAVGAGALGTEMAGSEGEPTLTALTAIGVAVAGVSSIIQKTIQRHSS